ncbi:MAG: choice-of-anchor W domain-containing protein [Planctomycetota bacterium]
MRGVTLSGVAVCAGAVASGSAMGAVDVVGGAGWSGLDTVWGGKVRNMTHTNGDWEMALGQTPGSFALHGHTTWAASGSDNAFRLSYSNLTGDITLEWNGSVLSWNDADRAESLGIQLLARGKSGGDATYTVGDLAFNGEAIDLGGAAAFASAGTTIDHGVASYLWVGGDEFSTLDSWTLSGTLNASWSGSTPSRDLSRVEFIASNNRLTIPTPAGLAAMGLTAFMVTKRRR